MFTEKDFEKSWKCPSDRELLLRSKIQYGWSVHTSNLFRRVEAIPPAEVEAIARVIRRANRMEQLEIERVGRMICRLQNMTNNTLGNGQNSCSMCGIAFGMFSSFVHCVDCQKAVCEKCKVDTSTDSTDCFVLCKICAENREVWKKSGGWFYGKFPTMSEECNRECVALSSGSPNVMRATWEHRAKDIVRMQSYEPPEENHNDHSQYKDWTVNSSTPDLNLVLNDDDNNVNDDDSEDEHYLELESFGKSFRRLNQSDNNSLSVQNTKLSASCPSLTELQAQVTTTKFMRRGAVRRRKRNS